MKKFLLLVLTCCLAFGVAMAQDQSSTASSDTAKSAKKAPAAPLKWLKGTISDDGKSFTADKDKSTWSIKNPDDVKGHEGHHVKVSAKLDEANHSVTIDKLTMMRASKQSGGKH